MCVRCGPPKQLLNQPTCLVETAAAVMRLREKSDFGRYEKASRDSVEISVSGSPGPGGSSAWNDRRAETL
ncbi:hypothetical protein Trco_007868 [Trichoderma cornu-damae]|uniref:Uncharacterized protein n=1 Tax=Trichoderma cornu-damae TaxID=654480 RepID=A0A9P8QL94_9HYPO|nr:hypothetical protein Trco_007868 [Trichoderma cornu-damae]